MHTLTKLAARLCLPGLLFSVNLTLADSDHETARQLREAGDILPLETILQNVQSIHSGKILEVELKKKRGRFLYEIELLDDNGKVWEFKVNAHTAEIVEQEEDD